MQESRSLSAAQALLPGGWRRNVRVSIGADGHIADVGALAPGTRADFDLLLPAPANLHSHSFQRAMAGMTETRSAGTDSFWTWRALMYRFLNRLTPDQVEAIAALAFMEMLQSGFGSVAEFHYLHHAVGGRSYSDPAEISARIIAAAERTGIGLTLLPVLYRFAGCDRTPPEGGQLRFTSDPDRFATLHAAAGKAIAASRADFALGVAPHSLRAVDAEGLAACLSLVPDGPIHIHVAEQQAEIAEFSSVFDARPVDWLLDNQPVDDRWCLIHCTHMSAGETRRLATSGAVAGLCPLTEANLGDGIFNGADFLTHGGRFGIGSDSNIRISPFDELQALEYSQRLLRQERAVLADAGRSTGRLLLDVALAGGAQALGRRCGAIAPGRWADLVAIDTDNPALYGLTGDQLLDGLVFCGAGTAVTDVWSAGRHVVRNGRHVQRDAIVEAYRKTMDELDDAA